MRRECSNSHRAIPGNAAKLTTGTPSRNPESHRKPRRIPEEIGFGKPPPRIHDPPHVLTISMDTIAIRPLGSADLADAARLLGTLNPDTPLPLVRERLATMLAEHPHYTLLGAFAGERLAGVCGAWIATKIWCGRYLEIDNLVVDPEIRSAGIGTRLISHLETIARERDCQILALDSYTSNHASHRLYHRLGFEIWGFHFIKPIGDWSGKDSA